MVMTALVMVIPLIFWSLSIILPFNSRLGSVSSVKVAKFSAVSELQLKYLEITDYQLFAVNTVERWIGFYLKVYGK